MALRDYQDWAVKAIWRYFEVKEGNPVIAMPTGTGKSHVLAALIWSMMRAFPSTRVQVLTHVKELIQQDYDKFVEVWPNAPVGIYSAGLNKKEYQFPITFGGIGSVAKKAPLFGILDILFVDECDLISHKENTVYRKYIAALKVRNPKLKVIGLTATPWRAGLGLITEEEGGIFTDVAVDMTGVDAFNWFVDEGYLSPLISKPTKLILDTSSLHLRGGEFIEKEMQDQYDKPEITRLALAEALEIASDREKWLIFASGAEHCQNVAEELSSMGRECRAIYSGMDPKRRKEYIDAHKYGELPALSNNNILTVGFDNPLISLLLVLRATMSARLWVQMLGRGTRPVFCPGFDTDLTEGRLAAIAAGPKHNCMVLDYSRNIERLGPINDPVIPRKKGKGGPQPAPVKECPNCEQHNHASVRFCGGRAKDDPKYNPSRGCGHEFLFEVKIKVDASTRDVVKKEELPIVQTFTVDHVTYALHVKAGAPPMLRASYYAGIKVFQDYICVEHAAGSPGHNRAKGWWKLRNMNDSAMPNDVDDALERADELKVPTHIDVWINTKYPVIKRYCFDGTAFGQNSIVSPSDIRLPSVDTNPARARAKSGELQVAEADYNDDDIPF